MVPAKPHSSRVPPPPPSADAQTLCLRCTVKVMLIDRRKHTRASRAAAITLAEPTCFDNTDPWLQVRGGARRGKSPNLSPIWGLCRTTPSTS